MKNINTTDLIYTCEICGKKIPKSNSNMRIINEKSTCLCGKHYAQYVKFGKFTDISQKSVFDANEFRVDGDITYIYTTTKNNEVSGYFIIDTEDLDRVICHKWRLWKGRIYTGVQKPKSIGNFILGVDAVENYDIDHINHNPMDNRKCNLRQIKHSDNIKNLQLSNNNISGFSGIHFNKQRNKWEVEIKCNYIKCKLGRYDKLEDACFVRYTAEKLVFKEFRNTCNDKNLIPMVESCQNKEELTERTTSKIKEKFSFI